MEKIMTRNNIGSEQKERAGFFSKAIFRLRRIVSRYISVRLKRKLLLMRWSHHADPRSFDWDWKSMNVSRIDVVHRLIEKFDNPSYLEIGCAGDHLFDTVRVNKKVGVDPATGGNVRKTSDDFFEDNNDRFDVVFIDGLHEYEQVRRDIINSIEFLNKGGWIALHDLMPRNWIEQHVPNVSSAEWTGDVWKVAFELLETDGIEFKIIKLDHGVGVIKVIDSKAILKDLRGDLMQEQFTYYYDNVKKLPIIEWGEFQDWIGS